MLQDMGLLPSSRSLCGDHKGSAFPWEDPARLTTLTFVKKKRMPVRRVMISPARRR